MVVPRARYLEALCDTDTLRIKNLKSFPTGLAQYGTANPVHARQVHAAVEMLKRHFGTKEPPRPLNCIVLGGPGSGKTYLVKQLRDAVQANYLEQNLSQVSSPTDIRRLFIAAAKLLQAQPAKPTLVFIDEFDVRIAGVAAVQFLIQPMYDGEILDDDGTRLSLKRAAFLFSGSYLKENRVLDAVVGGEQFDIVGVLCDAYHATPRQEKTATYRDTLWKEWMAISAYHTVRQQMLSERDVIRYVRSLEKIIDFVSRINGFTLELRDINTPLRATRKRFRVELEGSGASPDDCTPDPHIASQLIELVDGLREESLSERFFSYPDSEQPLLEYKNLLLIDRLGRVLRMLKATHPSKKIKLSRALLNYLIVVPLIHGMRSLTTIIEGLEANDRDELTLPRDRGVVERNVARHADYEDPDRIWSRLKRGNPNTFRNQMLKVDGAAVITVL